MASPSQESSLSRTQFLIAGVLVLVIVTGLSALVGCVAGGDEFNWDTASIFGTALGTTLLAIGTLGLAYSTWREVGWTQQLARDSGIQVDAVTRSLRLAEE